MKGTFKFRGYTDAWRPDTDADIAKIIKGEADFVETTVRIPVSKKKGFPNDIPVEVTISIRPVTGRDSKGRFAKTA